MFERRVKIFLLILILLTTVLIGRALQVQVLGRDYWRAEAVKAMTAPQFIDTTRGRLLDRRGVPIAEDVPAIDASVDYRAIANEPDEKWVREIALSRLRNRLAGEYAQSDRPKRKEMLDAEVEQVKADIKAMWTTLAQLGNKSPDEIDEIRQSIVRKVTLRRRYVWYWKYQDAMQDHAKREPPPWYQRWLMDDSADVPEVDQFDVDVAEMTAPQVILRAIDGPTINFLGKNRDRLPGLVLQPSMHRFYPYHDVAAHLIGYMGTVGKKDVGENDLHRNDPLRKYEPNDLIGRAGLEDLCEPLLRGKRGRIEQYLGGDEQRELARVDPVPGTDVRTTIDIELQHDLQNAFRDIHMTHRDPDWEDRIPWMPGAAIVIDVPSGEVLAMVSYPTYDLNGFDERYGSLNGDDINRPLMNRATQFALEPGSTVKPIVGLAAITEGLLPIDGTIECTGSMFVNGKASSRGRCWVESMFQRGAHHPIPETSPHPTGFLTFSDALERSCNIYFETLAEKLGMEGLARCFDRFGLGRRTGVGVAEFEGMVPGDQDVPAYLRRSATWYSGIGQSQVLATPIQMVNVAATIARNGTWVRPRLVPAGTQVNVPGVSGPDRIDLHLSPAAVAAARDGMTRVVNGAAGTGKAVRRDDLLVAGKTGSATAQPLSLPRRDESGKILYKTVQVPKKDPVTGETLFAVRRVPERWWPPLGTHARPNPEAPWYRGGGADETQHTHAWFMGFAPADNPRVAFVVMVEYGWGGGTSAAQVAKRLLDACITHGYLAKR